MVKFFQGLGAVWVVAGVYQFVAMRGDPDQGRTALLFVGMAGCNFLVAWYLDWRRERRGRAER